MTNIILKGNDGSTIKLSPPENPSFVFKPPGSPSFKFGGLVGPPDSGVIWLGLPLSQ